MNFNDIGSSTNLFFMNDSVQYFFMAEIGPPVPPYSIVKIGRAQNTITRENMSRCRLDT